MTEQKDITLEEGIKNMLAQKMVDGTIEKLVSEQFEKGINKALDNMFGHWGDLNKVLEKKLKEVLVPYLEGYDYSEYIVKLDSVLVEILKQTALPHKQMLENFKDLIVTPEAKEMKASDIFNKWKEFVAKNVETDGLEIDYDDTPSYSYVEITMSFEEEEGREWSSFAHGTLYFECEHDDNMNRAIRLSKWKERNDYWTVESGFKGEISSLRNLDSIDVFFMKLAQNGTKIIMDEENDSDDVRPEKEPEVYLA